MTMPETNCDAAYERMQRETDEAQKQPTSGAFRQEKLPIYAAKRLRKDVDPSRDLPSDLPKRRA
jgi:hypothetical protein